MSDTLRSTPPHLAHSFPMQGQQEGSETETGWDPAVRPAGFREPQGRKVTRQHTVQEGTGTFTMCSGEAGEQAG